MSKTILMLATFGLEIVEVGGTLALHAQAGDTVHAAVLLSREASRPQIEQAAKILGIQSVQFLNFDYGEVQPDTKELGRGIVLCSSAQRFSEWFLGLVGYSTRLDDYRLRPGFCAARLCARRGAQPAT